MTDCAGQASGQAVRRLGELGFELPPPPAPKGYYAGARIEGYRVHVSGHTDRGRAGRNGAPVQDTAADVAAAGAAAEHAAVNLLASVATVCSLDDLDGVIMLRGYVVGSSGFASHPRVIDRASRLLHAVVGGPPHARAAIGVASLPGGAVVELEAVFALAPGYQRRGEPA